MSGFGAHDGPGCERWGLVLSRWLDGETVAIEQARLRRHLPSCSRCSAFLVGSLEVGELLSPEPGEPAPPPTPGRMIEKAAERLRLLVRGVLARRVFDLARESGLVGFDDRWQPESRLVAWVRREIRRLRHAPGGRMGTQIRVWDLWVERARDAGSLVRAFEEARRVGWITDEEFEGLSDGARLRCDAESVEWAIGVLSAFEEAPAG